MRLEGCIRKSVTERKQGLMEAYLIVAIGISLDSCLLAGILILLDIVAEIVRFGHAPGNLAFTGSLSGTRDGNIELRNGGAGLDG